MYKWNKCLETGHNKIDNQHKLWISALNSVTDAFLEGKAKEEIAKTMEFLILYTIKHFSDEEDLMLSYNYTDYFMHKRCHEEFKINVKSITRKLIKEGPSEKLVEIVIFTVRDWLINHIKNNDFQMINYIKTREKRRLPALETIKFT